MVHGCIQVSCARVVGLKGALVCRRGINAIG